MTVFFINQYSSLILVNLFESALRFNTVQNCLYSQNVLMKKDGSLLRVTPQPRELKC